ncbi:hypothetical protein GGF43_000946 [Coemansia sp. RSA 2618]|nr:hypothetical protein GGF43_000946 [Coemansia sp. RSA 2618]
MAFLWRRVLRICAVLSVFAVLAIWWTREIPEVVSTTRYTTPLPPLGATPRMPESCFVFLTRSMSLTKVRRTMFDIEQRFNRRFKYPYVFLGEQRFSPEFQHAVRAMASGDVTFAIIDDWDAPAWVDLRRVDTERRPMGFRNMVRYWAQPFALHPALKDYTFVWRLEPGAHFTCDFVDDPFRRMQTSNLSYAFAMSIEEVPSSAPSVWPRVLDYIKKLPRNSNNNSLAWIAESDRRFNRCQFLTNFELVDLRFIRSRAYQLLFKYLDEQAGFYYELWSDATVRSLAAALLLDASKVQWLGDIGYSHDLLSNCPADPERQKRCHCDPAASSHLLPMSCSTRWSESLHVDTQSFLTL